MVITASTNPAATGPKPRTDWAQVGRNVDSRMSINPAVRVAAYEPAVTRWVHSHGGMTGSAALRSTTMATAAATTAPKKTRTLGTERHAHAAEGRRQPGRDAPHPRHPPLHLAAFPQVVQVARHGVDGRPDRTGTETLDAAKRNQRHHVPRERGQRRTDQEDDDADD